MATTIFLVNPFVSAVTPPTYLLDTYSAAAAYSLRQLKTGVTNVVRVRRSSDNAESDFTATEITDGTLTTWTGANDGFVVTWYDQSGNGNNVTQSTAANQPRLVLSGSAQAFASGNGISFLSSTTYLSLGSGLTALNAEPFSVFTASENSSSDGGVAILTTTNTVSNSDRVDFRLDADGTSNTMMRVRNNSLTNYDVAASTNLSSGTDYLISYFSDSSKNLSVFDNGNTGGTNTFTGFWTNNDMYVGANFNLVAEYTGVIGELIIFGTDESANRTSIETDINTHYSIY